MLLLVEKWVCLTQKIPLRPRAVFLGAEKKGLSDDDILFWLLTHAELS